MESAQVNKNRGKSFKYQLKRHKKGNNAGATPGKPFTATETRQQIKLTHISDVTQDKFGQKRGSGSCEPRQ